MLRHWSCGQYCLHWRHQHYHNCHQTLSTVHQHLVMVNCRLRVVYWNFRDYHATAVVIDQCRKCRLTTDDCDRLTIDSRLSSSLNHRTKTASIESLNRIRKLINNRIAKFVVFYFKIYINDRIFFQKLSYFLPEIICCNTNRHQIDIIVQSTIVIRWQNDIMTSWQSTTISIDTFKVYWYNFYLNICFRRLGIIWNASKTNRTTTWWRRW